MSNIINLIERLGADSQLRYSTGSAVTCTSQLVTEANMLICQGNVAELERLLNVRQKIVCMVFPVEEPQEQPDQPADDEPDDKLTRLAI